MTCGGFRWTPPPVPTLVVALGDSLAPAAPERPERTPVTFANESVEAHGYGIGPRRWRWLPGGSYGVDGALGTLMVANLDPVGRLGIVAQGGVGDPAVWRGGSLQATYRKLPFDVNVAGWLVEQRPSAQRERGFAPPSLDAKYTGGSLLLEREREWSRAGYVVRGAASVGTLDGPALSSASRALAIGEARGRLTMGLGMQYLAASAGGTWAIGKTAGEPWTRGLARATLTAGTAARYIRAEAARGITLDAAPGEYGLQYEAFVVGGSSVPWFDPVLLSQRIAMPAVPVGFLGGRKVGVYRATLGGVLPGELSMTWVAAGDSLVSWKRIVTLEQVVTTPALGFARLPAVSVRAGVGYSMDEPFRARVRGYVGLRYSP